MLKEAFERVKDQMGPCGITCVTCKGGNGIIAGAAKKLQGLLQESGIPSIAPTLPGGSEIDFDNLERALTWVQTYTLCPGCEQGGGPPDCAIRICSKERGYVLCSECPDLEGCDKFDWLGDYAEPLKEKLKVSKGRSKQEITEEAISKMEH
ncbi:MAG: DUF3795 domain-containing protein [Candidatus Bathyarchaeia archaeon]